MSNNFDNGTKRPSPAFMASLVIAIVVIIIATVYRPTTKPTEVTPPVPTTISPAPVAREETVTVSDGSIIVRDKGASFVVQQSSSNQPALKQDPSVSNVSK